MYVSQIVQQRRWYQIRMNELFQYSVLSVFLTHSDFHFSNTVVISMQYTVTQEEMSNLLAIVFPENTTDSFPKSIFKASVEIGNLQVL